MEIENKGEELKNKLDNFYNITPQDASLLEQNNKYFNEYKKLHEANIILTSQLNTLLKEKQSLKQTIQKIEANVTKNNSQNVIYEKQMITDTYTSRKVKFNLIWIIET